MAPPAAMGELVPHVDDGRVVDEIDPLDLHLDDLAAEERAERACSSASSVSAESSVTI